jgi:hypothetical protein
MTENFTPGCWVALNVIGCGPCDGRLVKAHLIPKQTIRREVGREHMWDDRVWVPVCGGPQGIGGHHGALDYSRRLRIPRDRIPEMVEEFAAEHGLVWWLEREYGEREAAA